MANCSLPAKGATPHTPLQNQNGSSTSSPAAAPPEQSALSRAKEAARMKAAGADKMNAEALERAKQMEKPHVEERERQDREAMERWQLEEEQKRLNAFRQEQIRRQEEAAAAAAGNFRAIGAPSPGVPPVYRTLPSGRVSPVQTIPRNLPPSAPPRSSSSNYYVPNYSYSRGPPTQRPVPSRGSGGTQCPAGMACTIR